jgi:SAM-dependent methyltransferase
MEAERWKGSLGERWLAHADRFEAMLAPIGAAAIAEAGFQPGERVLDVGCGGGENSLAIARLVGPDGSVTGLDISEALVAACAARARAEGITNATFVAGDAGSASLSPAGFDRLFSRFGVMFFADPYAAFAHLRSLLRPDAKVNFACWGTLSENPWRTEVSKILARYFEGPPPPPRSPGPFAFEERPYLEDILAKAGFRDVTIKTFRADQAVGGPDATPAEATDFTLAAMPFTEALDALPPERRAALRQELTELFERHRRPGGVMMGCTVWLVGARA